MAPDSDFSAAHPQRGTKRTRNGQTAVELTRQRSNTAVSRGSHHVRSRGSTASIQSCTTQYIPEQSQAPEGYGTFPRNQFGATQHAYNGNPEEIIMRFGEQLANPHTGPLMDPALQENHNSTRPRADMNFGSPDYPNHEALARTLQTDLPTHSLPGTHPGPYPALFDGVENHIPERAVGEPEATPEAGGPRKKKGTTSSIANDKELRRLLRQYQGYSLQEMAAEVQKHEGAGGKSEKVKQVFAMLWLQENCRRSSGSVRRDRVYSCYADKCGTERVSVLNPASFGKLVRIIFENVQTRRLGVRGESKYHYVDLTIVDQGPTRQPSTERVGSTQVGEGEEKKGNDSESNKTSAPQPTPQPTNISQGITTFPTLVQNASAAINCQSTMADLPDAESLTGFDAGNLTAQQKLRLILKIGPAVYPSAAENAAITLPDIRQYLPHNIDVDSAVSLTALYRSHCISVIDSFRFCREKALFRHLSAFQGTLTVPVHKLLVQPEIAPWIEECDWLMYQKMVVFVAPLATQVIPGQVLKAFRNISAKLLPHIAETLKSQPDHVLQARLAPAQIFCHLLNRILDANQAANSAAAWLCSVENRTQMLEDFQNFVTPIDVVARSHLPICSAGMARNLLRDRVKTLLTPVLDHSPPEIQFYENGVAYQKIDYTPPNPEDYTEFPERWTSFIAELPTLFHNHPAGCIIDTAEKMWSNILHRLTLGGSQSFSAWWMTKVFWSEIINWQAELGGFLNSTAKSLREATQNVKGGPSPRVDANLTSFDAPNGAPKRELSGTTNTTNGDGDKNGVSEPSGPNGATEVGDNNGAVNENLNHDDSAIDLGDDSMLLAPNKYQDMTASDPADAEGDVVVV